MTDDFIASLREDPKEQELERVRRRLAPRRRATQCVMVFEFLLNVVGIAAGSWFAWMAWKGSDVFFGFSAFMLLPIAAPLAIMTLRTRGRMLASAGSTPEETLRAALNRGRAMQRILKRSACGIR
jgi:hypothetical protein